MSGVSLSEQMGAMALIDELRHSQTEIQKHLDLPKHCLLYTSDAADE